MECEEIIKKKSLLLYTSDFERSYFNQIVFFFRTPKKQYQIIAKWQLQKRGKNKTKQTKNTSIRQTINKSTKFKIR